MIDPNSGSTAQARIEARRGRALPIDIAIIAEYEMLVNLLRRFTGLTLPAAPASAWETFHSLPVSTQKVVVAGWQAHAEFVKGALEEGIDSWEGA